MAVIRPSDEEVAKLGLEEPIMVDSDADSNAKAVMEIEAWCKARGMARVREGYLRTIHRDGEKPVRRGVCFKPEGDLAEQYQDFVNHLREQLSKLPKTEANSVELLREMRG